MKVYSLETALQNPSQVTALYAQGRGWRAIPKEIAQLPQLRILGLNQNQLSSFPEILTHLTELEELELAGNLLEALPFSFSQFSQLRKLDLSNNRLSVFPEVLLRLDSLEELNLSNNQLQKLPKSIHRLKKLRNLNLNQNRITKIPVSFTELSNLNFLNLSQNKLKILPPELRGFRVLKELDVSKNKLSAFPKGLENCKSLEKLKLSRNKFTAVPPAIGELKQLRQIDLSANSIQKLPQEIGQLQHLRVLRLQQNHLSTIPESIQTCHLLSHLDLSENRIQQFPEGVSALSNLEYLNLSKNQLQHWDLNLSKLHFLKKLDLSNNLIDQIPKSLIQLKRLQELKLRNNPFPENDPNLLKLDPIKFPGLSNNRYLKPFLSACKKDKVPFDWRPQLFEIYLSKETKQSVSNSFLEIALNNLLPTIRTWAHQYLHHQYKKQFDRFEKGNLVTILGKINLPFGLIKSALHEKGIQLNRKFSRDTSHILVGNQPGEVADILERPNLTWITENELRTWLQANAAGFLWRNAPDKALKRLERLLLSDQEENIQLAIQLLQTNGVPKDILNPIYVAYRRAVDSSQKRKLRQLLFLGCTTADLDFLNESIPLKNQKIALQKLDRIPSSSNFNPTWLKQQLFPST